MPSESSQHCPFSRFGVDEGGFERYRRAARQALFRMVDHGRRRSPSHAMMIEVADDRDGHPSNSQESQR